MFNYIKKEYQFTDNVESIRKIIKQTVDNSIKENTTGVLDNDDSFWIRDKYIFNRSSTYSIPTRIYGNIKSKNDSTIVSIRIVPDTMYFYLQFIAVILTVFDQFNGINWMTLLTAFGFIAAVTGIAYLDSRLIKRKFDRIINRRK